MWPFPASSPKWGMSTGFAIYILTLQVILIQAVPTRSGPSNIDVASVPQVDQTSLWVSELIKREESSGSGMERTPGLGASNAPLTVNHLTVRSLAQHPAVVKLKTLLPGVAKLYDKSVRKQMADLYQTKEDYNDLQFNLQDGFWATDRDLLFTKVYIRQLENNPSRSVAQNQELEQLKTKRDALAARQKAFPQRFRDMRTKLDGHLTKARKMLAGMPDGHDAKPGLEQGIINAEHARASVPEVEGVPVTELDAAAEL